MSAEADGQQVCLRPAPDGPTEPDAVPVPDDAITRLQAGDTLRFIVGGLRASPTDAATRHEYRFGDVAARLDAGDTTRAVTDLLALLHETRAPLRADQAQGIADAAHALGVSEGQWHWLQSPTIPETDR